MYLNEGRGEPWAGQVMASPEPDSVMKVEDFNFEENLGLVVPMGSKIIT